jgi:predicted PilT family ATPase
MSDQVSMSDDYDIISNSENEEESSLKKENLVIPDFNSQDAFPALSSGNEIKKTIWTTSTTTTSNIITSKSSNKTLQVLQFSPEQIKASSRSIATLIRQISQETGAEINASSSMKSGTTFRIEGNASQVEEAKKKLQVNLSRRIQMNMNVPSTALKFIIGSGGQVLRDLERQTMTKIQVPPREGIPEEDDSIQNIVSISVIGYDEGVDKACRRIQQIVDEKALRKTVYIDDIDVKYYRFLAHHTHLNQLIQESGVRVRIPTIGKRDDTVNGVGEQQSIMVSGRQNVVETIVKELHQITDILSKTVRDMVLIVPKPYHRYIIGQRGTVLRELEQNIGCFVDVPSLEDPSEEIKLTGSEEALKRGFDRLVEQMHAIKLSVIDVSSLVVTSRKSVNATVHAKRVIRYLTKRGKLHELETEHHISVYMVPYIPPNCPVVVTVSGRDKDQVKLARKTLESWIQQVPIQYVRVFKVNPALHAIVLACHQQTLLKQCQVYLVGSSLGETNDELLLVYERSDTSSIRSPQAALEKAERQVKSIYQQDVQHYTKDIHIDSKYHRRLYDEKVASLINDASAPLAILMGGMTDKLDGLDAGTVRVVGLAEEDVERAVQILLEAAKQAQEYDVLVSYKTEVKLMSKFAGQIIGKQGGHLNRIREEFDVKLQVINDVEGEDTFKIVVQGLKKQADAAAKELRELQHRLADMTTERIRIEPKLHPALIGSQGRHVHRLEERYNVRIKFPRPGDSSKQAPDEIVLSGGRKGVAAARDELLELAAYERERSFTVEFTVASRHLPYIVGRQYAKLDALRDETNTQITIQDQPAEEEETSERRTRITIQGTKEDVASARQAIEAIVKEREDQITLTLQVPIKYHRVLIGSGGSHIRELVERCGGSDPLMVRFPNQQAEPGREEVVTIQGPKKVAQKIYDALSKEVDELKARLTIEFTVPTADRTTRSYTQGTGNTQSCSH